VSGALAGLYLKKVLGYPADTASQLLQIWKATVYLTPLIGAYLADAVMGRCVWAEPCTLLCSVSWLQQQCTSGWCVPPTSMSTSSPVFRHLMPCPVPLPCPLAGFG
jgi:hypothetical protein